MFKIINLAALMDIVFLAEGGYDPVFMKPKGTIVHSEFFPKCNQNIVLVKDNLMWDFKHNEVYFIIDFIFKNFKIDVQDLCKAFKNFDTIKMDDMPPCHVRLNSFINYFSVKCPRESIIRILDDKKDDLKFCIQRATMPDFHLNIQFSELEFLKYKLLGVGLDLSFVPFDQHDFNNRLFQSIYPLTLLREYNTHNECKSLFLYYCFYKSNMFFKLCKVLLSECEDFQSGLNVIYLLINFILERFENLGICNDSIKLRLKEENLSEIGIKLKERSAVLDYVNITLFTLLKAGLTKNILINEKNVEVSEIEDILEKYTNAAKTDYPELLDPLSCESLKLLIKSKLE